MLFDHGIHMDRVDINGESALHIAVRKGSLSLTRRLIDQGMTVDVPRTTDGYTALHLAAEGGDVRITESLLYAGADTQVLTVGGETACHLAEKNKHEEVLQLFRDAAEMLMDE